MVKNLYIILASFFVCLGVVGIFVPVLPTTPFLLLAIWLYMRSSRKGVKMILRNKYLSPYVASYFSRKGIPPDILLRTLFLLWGTLAVAALWVTDNLYIRILLLIIGISVSVHLYLKRSRHSNKRTN